MLTKNYSHYGYGTGASKLTAHARRAWSWHREFSFKHRLLGELLEAMRESVAWYSNGIGGPHRAYEARDLSEELRGERAETTPPEDCPADAYLVVTGRLVEQISGVSPGSLERVYARRAKEARAKDARRKQATRPDAGPSDDARELAGGNAEEAWAIDDDDPVADETTARDTDSAEVAAAIDAAAVDFVDELDLSGNSQLLVEILECGDWNIFQMVEPPEHVCGKGAWLSIFVGGLIPTSPDNHVGPMALDVRRLVKLVMSSLLPDETVAQLVAGDLDAFQRAAMSFLANNEVFRPSASDIALFSVGAAPYAPLRLGRDLIMSTISYVIARSARGAKPQALKILEVLENAKRAIVAVYMAIKDLRQEKGFRGGDCVQRELLDLYDDVRGILGEFFMVRYKQQSNEALALLLQHSRVKLEELLAAVLRSATPQAEKTTSSPAFLTQSAHSAHSTSSTAADAAIAEENRRLSEARRARRSGAGLVPRLAARDVAHGAGQDAERQDAGRQDAGRQDAGRQDAATMSRGRRRRLARGEATARRVAHEVKEREAEATRRFLKETAPALAHSPTIPLEELEGAVSSPTAAQRRRLDRRCDKRLARRLDDAERRRHVAEVFGLQ
jgi:hypothetical protein